VVDNDPKGLGPAIMAGLQVFELSKPSRTPGAAAPGSSR